MRWLTMVAAFGLAGCLPMEDGTMGLRIDTPQAANAYQGAGGGTGHWQDTDPDGGTEQSAEWTEFVQEAICETIEGLGGTLDGTESGQLWGLLAPRVGGIRSSATDMATPVTTAHTRVVVGATNSRASGQDSVALASLFSGADGYMSLAAACFQGTASGDQSVAMAGINFEVGSDAAIGLGYGSTPPTPNGTNQNLSILLKAIGGHAHFKGKASFGGDVDAGTGALASVDGATGAGTFTGGVTTASGATVAAYGTPWTATLNSVGGVVSVPFSATHPLAYTYGTVAIIRIANNRIATNSRFQYTIDYPGSETGFPIAYVRQGDGTVDVVLQTFNPGVDIETNVLIRFDVINPAPAP